MLPPLVVIALAAATVEGAEAAALPPVPLTVDGGTTEGRAEACGPGVHELRFEYRSTDMFDEPLLPYTAPAPDRVYFASDRVGLTATDSLLVEAEELQSDDVADRERLFLLLERRLPSGGRLRVGCERLWVGDGGRGFSLLAGYGRRMGPNVDCLVSCQGIRSTAGTWGGRVGARGEAALSRLTAARVRGWHFRDGEQGARASLGEVTLAQYLGARTAIHASARRYVVEAAALDGDSTVASVELRRAFGEGTVARFACRWYEDGSLRATSLSGGVQWSFTNGSLGVHYRRHETSEGLGAGTWWVALGLRKRGNHR